MSLRRKEKDNMSEQVEYLREQNQNLIDRIQELRAQQNDSQQKLLSEIAYLQQKNERSQLRADALQQQLDQISIDRQQPLINTIQSLKNELNQVKNHNLQLSNKLNEANNENNFLKYQLGQKSIDDRSTEVKSPERDTFLGQSQYSPERQMRSSTNKSFHTPHHNYSLAMHDLGGNTSIANERQWQDQYQNESRYEPVTDYQKYYIKAKDKTNSDCLSAEKTKATIDRSYQDRLLKSIERKAMKDLNGVTRYHQVRIENPADDVSRKNQLYASVHADRDYDGGQYIKFHSDLLREKRSQLTSPQKTPSNRMNNNMKEQYMDFVVKRDIIKGDDSDLNQSPSAEKRRKLMQQKLQADLSRSSQKQRETPSSKKSNGGNNNYHTFESFDERSASAFATLNNH